MKVDPEQTLGDIPSAQSDGGGFQFLAVNLGYTPHNLSSRLADWHKRFGPRPGLMLLTALVSDHVDEGLRLVNGNRRVGAVWRRGGGPLLVRHLLYSHAAPQPVLLPRHIEGCDIAALLERFLAILNRFGSARLKTDIARFGGFIKLCPGADLETLDHAALQLVPS